jgi:hypothetical protein
MRRSLVAALSAATLLTACGSSSDPTSTTVGTTASSRPSAPSTTPPIGPTVPRTTVALPSTGNADIDALITKSRTAEYHVVYDNGAGAAFEIYRSGTQIALFSQGQAIYQLANGTGALCQLDEPKICNSMPGNGSIDQTLSGLFGAFGAVLSGTDAADAPFDESTAITDQTIVGRPAKCVSAAPDAESSFSVCLDADIGILLSASGSSGATARTVTAQLVEIGPVDQSIFELPSDIVA